MHCVKRFFKILYYSASGQWNQMIYILTLESINKVRRTDHKIQQVSQKLDTKVEMTDIHFAVYDSRVMLKYL